MQDRAPLQNAPAAPGWRLRLADYLGLEYNVVAASTAVFLIGLGEGLWKRFLPKYLEALGAGPLAIGLFGTAQDFLEAVYQYAGGWFADRHGRRQAFLVFIAIAALGYLVYLFSPSWPWLFAGLVLTMVWQAMASPVIFAVIGDALPRERRVVGFTVQSILKRVPLMIAPIAGGAMLAAFGVRHGIQAALAISVVFAAVAALSVRRIRLPIAPRDTLRLGGVWGGLPVALKRLLLSDVIIRTCEGLAGIFIVLYATDVIGISLGQFGVLVALQVSTSILVYIPAAKIADRVGRKPFVLATFTCFALFPLAVVLASGFWSLVAAFVIGGLREVGEPSRKALIVDHALPDQRARTVGLYYTVRSLAVTPAAMLGGLLWLAAPQWPFYVAALVGVVGTVVFFASVPEHEAG